MAGFRAAGWTSFAAALLSFLIALVGLRGIGVVGQRKVSELPESTIGLSTFRRDERRLDKFSQVRK